MPVDLSMPILVVDDYNTMIRIIRNLLKQLGFEGMVAPLKLSCQDHQGADLARVQQWDGNAWKVISEYYTADQKILAPMVADAWRNRWASNPRAIWSVRARNTCSSPITAAIAMENFRSKFNPPLGIEAQGFCVIPKKPGPASA